MIDEVTGTSKLSTHADYRDESTRNIDGSDAKKRRKWSILSQILASTAKNVILFSCGLSLGFPTIVIPSVYKGPDNSTLQLTEDEVSWFGSINYITIPLGSIISGTVSERFGRKRSMQALTIPLLITWIMYYYADSALLLCSATALGGLVGGVLEAPVLTYISEICEPHVRGILIASSQFSTIVGILTQYSLGSFLDWRTVGALCAIGPILGFLVLFFVPESPHWLMSKNRFDDTEKALCWLRGWTTKEYIRDEYDKLVKEIHPELQTVSNNELSHGKTNRFCSFDIENYKKRTFIMPFLLMLITFCASQFSGILTLMTYAVNIFNSFGVPIDAHYATVMFGVAQLVGAIACMMLIHYTGKRLLAFVSIVGITILFGGVGLYGYFYLGLQKLDNGAHVEEQFQGNPKYSWFPMICFIGGSFLGFLGLRSLPWAIVGEIFPADIRGAATGISAGVGYFLGFITNKTFFNFIAAFTLPGVFIFYAGVGIVSFVVFYYFLPETEGWLLVEVEEHFAGKRNLIKAGRKKKNNSDKLQGKDSVI